MAAEAGRNFLLKSGPATGATTISAQQQTSFKVAGTPVDITNKDSQGWQELLSGAGKSSLEFQAAGVMIATDGHATLLNAVMNKTLATYTMFFDTNNTLQGVFQITEYTGTGEEGDASKFSITLQSSGVPTLVAT